MLGHLSNRSKRVGIYAGLGCMDAGPALVAVAEMLQAPVATSVSGKGCIPTAILWPWDGGTASKGRVPQRKFSRMLTWCWPSECAYSEVSTANYAIPPHNVIHVDANPNNLGRNVPTCVKLCADSQVFFDRLLADALQSSVPLPSALEKN